MREEQREALFGHKALMSNFRKKPVVIQAMQITKEYAREHLAGKVGLVEGVSYLGSDTGPGDMVRGFFLGVDTLEGRMRGGLGDWLIRGIKGELYFCKPDIFDETYDPA